MESLVTKVAGPVEYGSAPFWYNKTQALYFVNIYQSEIHKYSPQLDEHVFAKVGDKPVAFVIPIEDFNDKFLIGYGSDLAAVTWDEKSNHVSKIKIIENVDSVKGNKISDGKISPSGTLFVGTSGPGDMSSNDLKLNKAAVFSFKECEIKKLIPNVSASSGMAWSKMEDTFYYIDCPEYRIERYCFNKQNCDLKKGCILYEFKDDNLPGFPCGLTIDNEEQLWVGCFNGGQIIKINPKTGKTSAKIEIPNCPQITSVVFGGKNLDTLFVTTAAYKMKMQNTNAGFVYKVSGLGIKGKPSVPLRLISNK